MEATFSSYIVSILGKMQMLTVSTYATDVHTKWDLQIKLVRLILDKYTDTYLFLSFEISIPNEVNASTREGR